MIRETLEWFAPAEKLPDDNTTVLLRLKEDDSAVDDEPVWPGYYEDDTWYLADCAELYEPPTLWAHLPTGEAAT